MFSLIAIVAALFFSHTATAPTTISFPTEDGGVVFADVYGTGDRGIVLADGGPFNKESWAKQAQTLAAAGFQVLALDFRGYGMSRGPGQSDPMNAPLHFGCTGGSSLSPRAWREERLSSRRQHGRGPRATHQSLRSQELIVLDGSAHAQFLFQTDQGERVMRKILHFLSTKSTTP